MNIFCEGPDRVGKSTQVTRLYKEIAARGMYPFILHFANLGIPEKDHCIKKSEMLYRRMFDIIRLNKGGLGTNGFILDRSHLGEWVYGKMYRDYDANFIWELEEDAKYHDEGNWNKNYLITFIDQPLNLISRDDGLSFSTRMKEKTVEVDRFIDSHQRSIIPNKILIDINATNEQEVWEQVKSFIWKEGN